LKLKIDLNHGLIPKLNISGTYRMNDVYLVYYKPTKRWVNRTTALRRDIIKHPENFELRDEFHIFAKPNRASKTGLQYIFTSNDRYKAKYMEVYPNRHHVIQWNFKDTYNGKNYHDIVREAPDVETNKGTEYKAFTLPIDLLNDQTDPTQRLPTNMTISYMNGETATHSIEVDLRDYTSYNAWWNHNNFNTGSHLFNYYDMYIYQANKRLYIRIDKP